MDNRQLLGQLGITKTEWGRLVKTTPRTLIYWFKPGNMKPVLVNMLLSFFVAHPTAFKLFLKYRSSNE